MWDPPEKSNIYFKCDKEQNDPNKKDPYVWDPPEKSNNNFIIIEPQPSKYQPLKKNVPTPNNVNPPKKSVPSGGNGK